jgi:hypothetical protein
MPYVYLRSAMRSISRLSRAMPSPRLPVRMATVTVQTLSYHPKKFHTIIQTPSDHVIRRGPFRHTQQPSWTPQR